MDIETAKQFEDQFGNVFDDWSGYLAQVDDNFQISIGEAEDAIADRVSHLGIETICEIEAAINIEWKSLFDRLFDDCHGQAGCER